MQKEIHNCLQMKCKIFVLYNTNWYHTMLSFYTSDFVSSTLLCLLLHGCFFLAKTLFVSDLRRLQNNTDLISDVFKKWNIRMPSGGTAGASTGSRKEFSILIAVMMVLSAGIGVAGIIGIIIARRKRKR